MHTYRKSKNEELWTVGYWHNNEWMPLSDYTSETMAMKQVNYLNGGGSEE